MKILKLILACTVIATSSCQSATFTSVDVEKFDELLNQNVQLVDVRTSAEFTTGHISGATNIDVKTPDFTNQCQKLLNKKQTVAVYCRSGKRSKTAAKILAEQGFTVYELNEGIVGWTKAGKPIE
ncbi:MAG: rhodanese-like domain-containing protein [Sphingobacteriia bacterium]|jgi:rhodanese-related sulfurtransferase|nr:rhodanese-like domain-containing protein [Paludibacteraceae bacterium]NCA79119.1 rhodanese-like domain-containing protein [Sphingobacteriia bacterium]